MKKDYKNCGSFLCRDADKCYFYQNIGFAACSGHPVINPDGECANFMCECCLYDPCREAVEYDGPES